MLLYLGLCRYFYYYTRIARVNSLLSWNKFSRKQAVRFLPTSFLVKYFFFKRLCCCLKIKGEQTTSRKSQVQTECQCFGGHRETLLQMSDNYSLRQQVKCCFGCKEYHPQIFSKDFVNTAWDFKLISEQNLRVLNIRHQLRMQDKSQKRLKRIFHENYNALKTLKEKCCAELDLETFKQEYRGIQCINESVQNQESESEATVRPEVLGT